MNIQYLTDERGNRVANQVPLDQWESIRRVGGGRISLRRNPPQAAFGVGCAVASLTLAHYHLSDAQVRIAALPLT